MLSTAVATLQTLQKVLPCIRYRFGPFWEDERPEAKKRRKRWVSFVQQRRTKWLPEKGSKICSKHFKDGDFTRLFFLLPGQSKPVIPRLKRDAIGVTVYPSIQVPLQQPSSISKRGRIVVS